jgi:hypothetical protein
MLAILTLVSLTATPVTPPQAEEVRWARVSAATTTAHAQYDSRAVSVGEFAKGTPMRVVGEMTPWVKVQVPGGYDTWIHGDYVVFDGVNGRPINDRTRVRPLPSTTGESFPMGHYATGDVLVRLAADGDWIKVRAPERISAWVKTADLTIVDSEPEGWTRDWQDWAKRRTPVGVAPPRGEDPREGVGEDPSEPSEGGPVAGQEAPVAGGPVPAAGDAAGSAAEASASGAPALPDAEAIAEDPRAAMVRVRQRLDALYKRMVADREHWDRPTLDALEAAAGEIVWHTEDARTLDQGRAALRRVDVLRRAYLDALGRQVRNAEKRGDEEVAALLKQRLDTASMPLSVAAAPQVVLGLVAFRPEPNAGRPYVVERLGYEAKVHSFDGRYALADYRDREVVLRGTWKVEGQGEQAYRVFAITALRVLPRIDD